DGGDIAIPSHGPVYPWSVGDINALPESVLSQGEHQPCMTGEDCQFDQFCNNPAKGACAHDPCASGNPLLSTCSPCVTKICDANPTCCVSVAAPNTCLHDPCTAGSALSATCGDACVASICAFRP